MSRKTFEELEQIKKELSIQTLWSWSRINTYITDTYTYLLHYILHIPEDRNDSIYSTSGSFAHTMMEKMYLEGLTNEQAYELITIEAKRAHELAMANKQLELEQIKADNQLRGASVKQILNR